MSRTLDKFADEEVNRIQTETRKLQVEYEDKIEEVAEMHHIANDMHKMDLIDAATQTYIQARVKHKTNQLAGQLAQKLSALQNSTKSVLVMSQDDVTLLENRIKADITRRNNV